MTTAPLAEFLAEAARRDAADPLAAYTARFVQHRDVRAYLDGNSLGRPLAVTAGRVAAFVEQEWGGRLIRGWDERWMDAPTAVGDLLGRVTLGAAPGQTALGDSTTVWLYKLARAAVAARPRRSELVIDSENFPTDRFVAEGIAAECGLTLRWIHPDPTSGVTVDDVAAAVGDATALVMVSHVAFKSAYIADIGAITAIVHDAGALVLWDLCHSVGVVDVQLDAADVDLAVGCTYKYLNGGPGAPAFGYVAGRLHDELRQPVQGWMGAADPFTMGPRYEPDTGMRRFLSGTAPIVGMQALGDMLELIDEVGIAAVRAKSVALTEFAIAAADAVLAPLGVTVDSPREPAVRGGHVMISHPEFRRLTAELWEQGIIPDFRPPQGMRLGLSPLSTTFGEVADAVAVVAELLSAGTG